MTSNENLLFVAMEECGEIIQALSKIIRFGFNNCHPVTKQNNSKELLVEYYQLQAIIEKMQRDGKLPYLPSEEIKNIKKGKIRKMGKYYKKFERRPL